MVQFFSCHPEYGSQIAGHIHHLSELIMKRLWKLSACECVAVVNVLSRALSPTLADNHVLQMNRYFFASGQSCTMILLTYLSVTPRTTNSRM